ncbi:hypothetical protein RBB78_19680 [Tunturiibacter empetritectus]
MMPPTKARPMALRVVTLLVAGAPGSLLPGAGATSPAVTGAVIS